MSVYSSTSETGGRWTACAVGSILFFCAVGASALTLPLTVSGPIPTAQVGVPYSSALTVSTALSTPHYGIQGSLPPGLTLNSATGTISGTPTAAGTYTFFGWVGGSVMFLVGGFPVYYSAYGQSEFTITVLPPAVIGVPVAAWTLALAMVGLAMVGWLRLRHA